jgi:galactoside O-acetyltransferase
MRGTSGNRLKIGENSLVHAYIVFEEQGGHVGIGSRTFIGSSHIICYRDISVGDDVLVSWGVTIVDHDSHSLDWQRRSGDVSGWARGRKDWSGIPHAPVVIADKAWLGFKVTVLKGVTIGEGAVVAACSVVTKDVPPYCLAAGNPARVIRELVPGEKIG